MLLSCQAKFLYDPQTMEVWVVKEAPYCAAMAFSGVLFQYDKDCEVVSPSMIQHNIVTRPKPSKNSLCLAIYATHETHLMISLQRVCLLDTDPVDPYISETGCVWII